jgi:hypothetical protein
MSGARLIADNGKKLGRFCVIEGQPDHVGRIPGSIRACERSGARQQCT